MRLPLALLLLFLASSIFAQRPPREGLSISGKITEVGSNAPLEYATISFMDRSEKVITGGITDEKEIIELKYHQVFIPFSLNISLTKQRHFPIRSYLKISN